jgi:Protein of unknown function (DUF3606)
MNAISHLHPAATEALFDQPINITEEVCAKYWAAAPACSKLELRVAVAEVGPTAEDAGTELGEAP